jgi:hypothetical protein
MKLFPSILSLAVLASPAFSQATITYNSGNVYTSNASGPSWVGGSNMYLFITSGDATGATQSGFTTIPDVTLLTWSFDDLDLVVGESISPGAASAGLEVYRDTDSSSNLQFFYDGALWLTGLITEYQVMVDNNADFNAVGEGYAVITGSTVAGTDLYNEILSLTGGSGNLTFSATNFAAVAAGHFQSPGAVSAVPEPADVASLLGLAALGCVWYRRRLAAV